MSTQEKTETTGIKGADEFAAKALELGLTVTIKTTMSEAAYYSDGNLMLPAVLSVAVMVEIPVPEELNGSYLAMMQRCVSLTSYWSKRDKPRARGRWVLANYSHLGGHEDMHVTRRMHARLATMAASLESLKRLVEG